MHRGRRLRGHLAVLAVIVALTAGCRRSDAGTGALDTIPDTVTTTEQQATTTTTLTDEQAAYNVYRAFLDTAQAIGSDFNRDARDGSLGPYTTPAYREQIEVNLYGLKKNGLFLKGETVTRLISSSIPKENQLLLKVCSRDDVDQVDRTGKQLSEPGIGKPQVQHVGLVRQGSTWLVDGSGPTGEPCDV